MNENYELLFANGKKVSIKIIIERRVTNVKW